MVGDYYETNLREFCGLKCVIQMMHESPNCWLQRHIWYPSPAGKVTRTTAGHWIKAAKTDNDPPRNMNQVDDQDLALTY